MSRNISLRAPAKAKKDDKKKKLDPHSEFQPTADAKVQIHAVKTLVVTCCDCQSHTLIHDYMKKETESTGNYLKMTIPGASLGFSNPDPEYPAWQGVALEQIIMFTQSHETKQV